MKGVVFGLISVLVALMPNIRSGNCNSQIRRQVSIRSNSITHVDSSDFIAHEPRAVHRRRRSVLNSSEMKEALDAHNQCRRDEYSSDMEFMIWNDYIASMADDWAKVCQWHHGQPYRDPSTMPYNPLGQNLYAISGPTSINITSAVNEWCRERSFYNYDTLSCKPGEMCGHYTQIVWAKTRELGCGYVTCSNLTGSNLTNAFYLVCNYGPAGNYENTKPFTKGRPCTQCTGGSMWCNQGLCNSGCSALGPTCTCAPVCQNNGTVNSATCSCNCQSGYYGVDCGKSTGISKSFQSMGICQFFIIIALVVYNI